MANKAEQQSNDFSFFNLKEASKISFGTFLGSGETTFSSVVIDSRLVVKGSLFVALKGERSDGHDFLKNAADSGATILVVDLALNSKAVQDDIKYCLNLGASILKVDNTLKALQLLAKSYIAKFPKLIRIGVTGSSGKTTTKEILGAILSTRYKVVMTEGNFNSEIGLPLMAFKVRSGDEVLILEMGIDHVGEMDDLVSILNPQLALITHIGSAHIGKFGKQSILAEEKGKIFSNFKDDCVGFISQSDDAAFNEKKKYLGRTFLYGDRYNKGFEFSNKGIDGWRIKSGRDEVLFPLHGKYNLHNFFAAVSVASYLGIDSSSILQGVSTVKPLFGRGRIIRGDVSIIEDCYNANEQSVISVLDFFRELSWEGRKILVLGSMKELGTISAEIHSKIGKIISNYKFDMIFLYGEEVLWTYKSIDLSSFFGGVYYFDDFEKLKEQVIEKKSSGDLWLLKGSRSMELEKLEPFLLDNLIEKSGEYKC